MERIDVVFGRIQSGKEVERENCKLEKRMSGATQGFTKNLHDIHLCAWTVPGYCPSRVRINILLSQDASANRCQSNFFPSALDFWTFEATECTCERKKAVDYPDFIISIMITLITLIIRIIRAPLVATQSLSRTSPRIVDLYVMKELDDTRKPEEWRCENIASHDAEDPLKWRSVNKAWKRTR